MAVKCDKLVLIKISLLATVAISHSSELCTEQERNKIANPLIKSNKSLWDPVDELLYPVGTFWKEGKNFYGCPCMLDKPCMRKCCQRDEAMAHNFYGAYCVPHEATWPWFQPNVSADEVYTLNVEGIGYFGLLIGNYCHGYILDPIKYPETDEFYVNFTEGTLNMPLRNDFGMGTDRYCLDYVPNDHDYVPYVCLPVLYCEKVRGILYPIGMCISVFFLFISVGVLLLLPEMRNLHGKCMLCHMASIILYFVFMVAMEINGKNLERSTCAIYGYIAYFALLCSFFWLNIMCIDISMTFSSLKRMRIGSKDTKKFIIYSSYAFGLPLAITVVMMIGNFHPNAPTSIIKHDFRENCWFSADTNDEKASLYAYYIGPIGAVVTCNAILFAVTAFSLWKMGRETSVIHAEDSGRHRKKEAESRLNLYVKLFIVMGVSWGMEVISWLVKVPTCYWFATDMFNLLQGLFIFIIFICKKRVKRQLIERYTGSFSGYLSSFRGGSTARSSLTNGNSSESKAKLKSKDSTASTSSAPAAV